MGEEERNPNPIYIVEDLVEDILLRLPLKSILRFKTVSKHWRSTLESRRFAERRMSVQKKLKILAVGYRAESLIQGDAEIDMVYLNATGPSLTCNGLVCFPEPDWVNVLNPSTGEYLRFYSGLAHYENDMMSTEVWWSTYNVYAAMGFGRDEVSGNYKVVSMLFDHNQFQILDVNIGEWRKLVRPPYTVDSRRKSACVNGSIYWLDIFRKYKILALDLHTEEFRDIPVLPPNRYTAAGLIVNLDGRLAVADTISGFRPEWRLDIWSMDAQEETWSWTYSINLSHRFNSLDWSRDNWRRWFRPFAVSKQGSLFFHDNWKNLFKYDPETDILRCLSPDICVISPFVENLVRLQPGSVSKIRPPEYRYERRYLDHVPGDGSRISSLVRRIELLIPNILLTSTLVSLIFLGYSYRYRS